jgi:integrase
VVPRAGFEPATTRQDLVSFDNYEQFLKDLEDFKLFAKSKLNFSQNTVYHYTSKLRTFMKDRITVSDKDIQNYIEKKKQECVPDYVSNIISAFKAYFRDYKGLKIMDGYRHPQTPFRMKEEIEPKTIKTFIESIDNLTVKCAALLLASSGLRKNEVLSLRKSDINRTLRSIIPNCHSGDTKHSGISFYNSEAEKFLLEYEKTCNSENDKLFVIGHETFLKAWNKARANTGLNLKPKDLRDFFSQELGKALIPDRYIDIFQGRAPRSILAKHYTPQGIKLLREIYDKANLKVIH